MDRAALESWLHKTSRTFRWNDPDDPDGYEAVEVGSEGLRWYRWSHRFREDGVHGEYDVCVQTEAEFLRRGPARELPAGLREEVEAFVGDRSSSNKA